MMTWPVQPSLPLAERDFRLIAVDLESILQPDGTIHHSDASALRTAHAAGAKVVLVSALPPRAVRRFWAQLGLGEPAVALNGTVVFDFPRQTVLTGQPLDVATVVEIFQSARTMAPKAIVGLDGAMGWTVSRMGAVANWQFHETGEWPLAVGRPRAFLDDQPVFQVWFDSTPEDLATLEAGLKGFGLAAMRYSEPMRLVLRSAAASRGWALSAVAGLLDVPLHQVMAIGDGSLDRTMLQTAAFTLLTSDLQGSQVEEMPATGAVMRVEGVAQALEQLLPPQLGIDSGALAENEGEGI